MAYSAAEDAALYWSPVDALTCPAYPYRLGDYGTGTPTADDVDACPGEIICHPSSNVWACE